MGKQNSELPAGEGQKRELSGLDLMNNVFNRGGEAQSIQQEQE